MKLRTPLLLTSILFFLFSSFALAQDPMAPRTPGDPGGDKFFNQKEKKPENTRMVQGVVKDPKDELVEGAVVQIKDTKTKEVRSFITLEDGSYRFHGLSTEIDYELRAMHEEQESDTRRLSVYNSNKKATINLQLKPKA